MPTGIPHRFRDGSSRTVEILPGPIEKLRRDDGVLVSACHEDPESVEPARLDGQPGVEGQGARENRGTLIPGRLARERDRRRKRRPR